MHKDKGFRIPQISKKNDIPLTWLILILAILGFIIALAYRDAPHKISKSYVDNSQTAAAIDKSSAAGQKVNNSNLTEEVLPETGVVLPATKWSDIGEKLVKAGVIDQAKFESLYKQANLSSQDRNLLTGKNNGNLKINRENSGYILNLLWAFGLANKNDILEHGEMTNPQYGGAKNFASTGGWTLAKGDAMNYYSKLSLVHLTAGQQALVDKVSRGIYRPCCGNSAHFPDCNHGMAMLGLLELMASQGATEQQMWNAALTANSYWFPQTYLTLATYMEQRGIDWKDVNPEEILGSNYSSAQGYSRISSQVKTPIDATGSTGCGA